MSGNFFNIDIIQGQSILMQQAFYIILKEAVYLRVLIYFILIYKGSLL